MDERCRQVFLVTNLTLTVHVVCYISLPPLALFLSPELMIFSPLTFLYRSCICLVPLYLLSCYTANFLIVDSNGLFFWYSYRVVKCRVFHILMTNITRPACNACPSAIFKMLCRYHMQISCSDFYLGVLILEDYSMLVHRGMQCELWGISGCIQEFGLPRRLEDPASLIRATVRVTARQVSIFFTITDPGRDTCITPLSCLPGSPSQMDCSETYHCMV